MCVSNLRKSKKSYYENLDSKNITDNKKFCGIVKPHSLNKVRSNTYIAFNEGEILLKHEYEIFNLFSLKLFQILVLKLMKDIYVTLTTFLTQLKKVYKNVKPIRVSLS